MRWFSIGPAIFLILLTAGPISAGNAQAASLSDALLNAAAAYKNARDENEDSAKDAFVQLLIESISNEQRIVRRRATYLLNVYFSNDTEVISKVLDFIEPDVFNALRTQGRINALHILTNAGDDAWSDALVAAASERIDQIAANPPADWGPKQAEYLQKLRSRIYLLGERTAAVRSFGTVQESDFNTANLTDIDLFVCEASRDNMDLVVQARSLAERLAERKFGRVRLRVWTADSGIPVAELSGHSTLIFDASHPEAKEVGRVEQAFAESSGLPPIRAVPNRGESSSWYLSLIICPVTGEQPIERPRLWLHVQDDAQDDLATALLDEIRGDTLHGSVIDLKPVRKVNFGPRDSQLRYFKSVDEEAANILLELLQAFIPGLVLADFSPDYEHLDWIRPGHYELWLSPDLAELAAPQ